MAHQPLQPFQHNITSARQYRDALYHVLLVYVRLCDDEDHPFRAKVPQVPHFWSAVQALSDSVSDTEQTEKDVLSLVLEVLEIMFFSEWAQTQQYPIADPTLLAVLLFSLQGNTRWKLADQVTPFLAKLKRMLVSPLVIHSLKKKNRV